MEQVTVELPIACVERWSQTATWSGVRIADVLRAVDARGDSDVRVRSLEAPGPYSVTALPATHSQDPLTLLALELDGQPLHPDHGYPCRLIAPNLPGVLQTKWLHSLEVL
jgi:DMSO/TMAO reductase YedYZ molybdopterin-dependent catalytic subunit